MAARESCRADKGETSKSVHNQTKAKHCIEICALKSEASKSEHIAGKGGKIEICAYRREADNDYKGRNLKVWRTMMKRRETRQKNADCADISPPYLIFVTGTTGVARVKNSVRCKFVQIERKKIHILLFLG